MSTGPRIPRWHRTSQAPRTWRDPNCANDELFGMWEPERTSPWMRWAYLAAALATVLLSYLKPWGFAA